MPLRSRVGTVLAALVVAACGAGADPEIVAIEYLRATRSADSDTAVDLLDIDEIVERVSRDIVIVNTDGNSERFLRDSIESLLWGLFQETPREEGLGYDARPADIDGERARVEVVLRDRDGSEQIRAVHLRLTPDGWKVSGASVDDLVSYAIQRLEERF